uniref:Uncharacterized protein n=1 Tax=Ignisphaera aggregans TaxID=334771 RepID=A0A7C4FHU8_9CREN
MGKEQELSLSSAENLVVLSRQQALIFIATCLASVAVAVFIVLASVTPVALFSGYPLAGYVTLVSSRLLVFERPVVFRALESVSTITLSLFIGSSLSIVLGTFVVARLLLRRRRSEVSRGFAAIEYLYLELAPVASIIAMLTLTLFTALLRVVVVDIIPALPLGGCVETTAGMLCTERSKVLYTGVHSLATTNRLLPFIAALALLILSALTMYIAVKLYSSASKVYGPFQGTRLNDLSTAYIS